MRKLFKFKEQVIVSKANDDWPGGNCPKNRKGRVWEVDDDNNSLAVRFDANIGGHNLSASGKPCVKGHGWYIERKYIRPILKKS